MACADWFAGFIKQHTARCPREDWPKQGTPEATAKARVFYEAWVHALDKRGIEERFALSASLDMAADPPAFLADHLPRLLKLAAEHRALGQVPAKVVIPDAEEDTPKRAEALAELKRLIGSVAASKRSSGPFIPGRPRTPQAWQARAVQSPAYLADAPDDDPVIAGELGVEPRKPPKPPEEIHLPEDDAVDGWI